MSSRNNRLKNIVLILIILSLAVVSVYHFQDKQKYIEYMSVNLTFDFGNMNSNILRVNHVLNRVIETSEISREDASYLKDASVLIARELMDYNQIAVFDLEKIAAEELPNASENTASDIGIFYTGFYEDFPPGDETITLNEEQLEKFQVIKKINDIWREEVEVHAVAVNPSKTAEENVALFLDNAYRDIYDNDSITDEHWVNLLVNLSVKTEAYLEEHYVDVDYGLGDYLSMNGDSG